MSSTKTIDVVLFKVTPCFVVKDENGVVESEGEAPTFVMYPAKPFSVEKTVADMLNS
jgi:hypothetical protein